MSVAAEFADVFRKVVARTPDRSPAVFTSAGCDSSALLLTLVEQGYTPTAFTFTLDDRESRDSVAARENARRLGVSSVLVRLPSDPHRLSIQAQKAVADGVRGKANIEVSVPFRALLKAAGDLHFRTALTGVQADNHFGVTRKEIINLRHSSVEEFDAHRRHLFATNVPTQNAYLKEYASKVGVELRIPYASPEVCDVFLGHSWQELNKPRQKEAIRQFPGLERLDVDKVRSNIQLGDGGGVAAVLARLLDDPEVNPEGFKRMTPIYRRWAA